MAILLTAADTLVLHVPKCAGHFVEHAAVRLGVPHVVPAAIGGECPRHGTRANYAAARRAVCFVRHPVAWIESWWRFHVGGWLSEFDQLPWRLPYGEELLPIMRRVGDDFPALVRGCLAESPGLVSRIFARYADACDAVLRVEDSDRELAELLGATPAMVKRMAMQNVSRPERTPHWPSGLKEAWSKAERAAIERWYAGSLRRKHPDTI